MRWDKKPENYLALLYFVCALIAFRTAWLFGKAVGELALFRYIQTIFGFIMSLCLCAGFDVLL